jgi:hypothetical protein
LRPSPAKLTIAAGTGKAALAGLTLAPGAWAQVTCSDVGRLNSLALDDFDDIAEDEIDDDLYETSFSLAGAEECSIDYGWDSVYSCMWVYSDYASASAAFGSQRSSVSYCLSGWSTRSGTPDATATDGYRTLAVNFYEGSGSYIDVEWAVVLEEHAEAGNLHYHVFVETAYLW